MNTRRTLQAVLCLAATSFLAPAAAGQIVIDFNPSNSSVAPGERATVEIRVSGLGDSAAPSLGSFDLEIWYDAALLTVGGVTFGDPVLGDQLDLGGLGSLTDWLDSSGSLSVFQLSLDSVTDLNSLQASRFILATIDFDSHSPGISPLVLTVLALADADGAALLASVGSAEITVVPEPAWGMAALGLACGAAAWLRRRRMS